jgi:hypothetical protein
VPDPLDDAGRTSGPRAPPTFTALGYGARSLRPLFARPAARRVLDAAIAVVMLALAASPVLGAL